MDESKITVKRMHEDGYDVCEVPLPAVITVVKDINSPRIPSLRGRMASKKYDLPVWKPADTGADTNKLGLHGSPTRVVKTQPPPLRNGSSKVIEGTPQESAKELLKELRLLSIV